MASKEVELSNCVAQAIILSIMPPEGVTRQISSSPIILLNTRDVINFSRFALHVASTACAIRSLADERKPRLRISLES